MSRTHLIQPLPVALAEARTAQELDTLLLSTKEGFNAFVHRIVDPPHLEDCAPIGTEITPADPRWRYHGEMLPVMTPGLRRGLLDARRMLGANRSRMVGQPQSMVIDGDLGTGKSTLLALIGRGYQGMIETMSGPDLDRIPVIYIDVPANRESNLHWSLPFAEFLGLDHTRAVGRAREEYRSSDLTTPVTHIMRASATRLVLIDGLERIRDSELRTAFDYFTALQDQTKATFVFCGTGAREIVQSARDDSRRASLPTPASGSRPEYASELPVLWVNPIPYSSKDPDAWQSVVGGFDDDLRLFKHTPGSLIDLSEYLHERTSGYIDSLNQLICQAAQEAITTGVEALDQDLLDDINIGRDNPDYTSR